MAHISFFVQLVNRLVLNGLTEFSQVQDVEWKTGACAADIYVAIPFGRSSELVVRKYDGSRAALISHRKVSQKSSSD